MIQTGIQDFSISQLKDNERTAFYNDYFIMADNLGMKIKETKDRDMLTLKSPVKTDNTLCLLCTNGSISIKVNYTDYTLSKNKALIITPGSLGQTLSYSDDLEICMLAFKDDRYFISVQPLMAMSLYQKISKSALLTLDEKEVKFYLSLYKLMREDLNEEEFNYKHEAITGYIQVLFAHSYQWFEANKEENKEEQNSRSNQIYLQFLSLVTQYHNTERSVTFYADKMCLTPKYLSQIILKVSGKYALDIIKGQVIFEAKALLKTNKYTIQEVSDKLNFPNPSFFGKYFKAEVGCTPKQYLKNG